MPSKSWPHTHLANTLILMYDQHVWTKGHRDSLVTLCSWLVSLNSNVTSMLNAKRKMLNAKRRHYHINAAWYIFSWWWVGIFQSYPALCLRLSWECANTQSHLQYSCMMCWSSVWNSPGIRGGAKPNQKMGWIPGMLLASAVQKVCNVCGAICLYKTVQSWIIEYSLLQIQFWCLRPCT